MALLSIDRDNAAEHLQLWQAVVNASPAHGADMPLYLAGMAAWVSGDGASATIALERALKADPDRQTITTRPAAGGPHRPRRATLSVEVAPASHPGRRRPGRPARPWPRRRTHRPHDAGRPPSATARCSATRARATARPPAPGIAI